MNFFASVSFVLFCLFSLEGGGGGGGDLWLLEEGVLCPFKLAHGLDCQTVNLFYETISVHHPTLVYVMKLQ